MAARDAACASKEQSCQVCDRRPEVDVRRSAGSAYDRATDTSGGVVVGSAQAFVRRHVVAAAVLFVTLGGTAFAMADGSLGGRAAETKKTYYACVAKRSGTLT